MEGNNKPKSEINLRKLMQKLGLGTNAFAEKCGMSSQSMSQFLRNKSLTTNTIYRIATALDIDPREMFFPTEEKNDLFSNADKKEQEGETLSATLRGDLPEGFIERDVNFVQQIAGSEPAYQVHGNGLVSENQQQMIQTSTFCPHCGKKVRVGVVLLDN